MQVAQPVTVAELAELKEKCKFKEEKQKGPKRKPESVADDDKDSVEGMQENDGGTLGVNLLAGSAGEADGGPYSTTAEISGYLYKQPATDSRRGKNVWLRLKAYSDIKAREFPLTVAAHHLIPGNAALEKSTSLLAFMEDGGKVTTPKGRKVTIDGNIGYDVNGSHNGVWLPGNYAIKKANPRRKIIGTTPKSGWSWGDLGGEYAEWQFNYVAGACKATGGQFHDTHASPYSESVKAWLDKIALALRSHLDTDCEQCKGKTVPPPFALKQRLYAFSGRLRGFVLAAPGGWKDPWFTSERWSGIFFENGKVSARFLTAYRLARATYRADSET